MEPSKRNNPFANSGMVTEVGEQDVHDFLRQQPALEKDPFAGAQSLSGMRFQQIVEQRAFAAGGGKFVAPRPAYGRFCKWQNIGLAASLLLFARH